MSHLVSDSTQRNGLSKARNRNNGPPALDSNSQVKDCDDSDGGTNAGLFLSYLGEQSLVRDERGTWLSGYLNGFSPNHNQTLETVESGGAIMLTPVISDSLV